MTLPSTVDLQLERGEEQKLKHFPSGTLVLFLGFAIRITFILYVILRSPCLNFPKTLPV